MEKLKRNLMDDYANKFTNRILQHSLRSQMIALYYSITKILENFPNTRDNHFIFGEPYEKQKIEAINKSNANSTTTSANEPPQLTDETMDELKPDARLFKKRPRKLLSDDGERVLNIWFIPHFTEVLTMYKKNGTDEFIYRTLHNCVRILTAFNDILHFQYAQACMNVALVGGAMSDSSTEKIRRKTDFSTWESSGGLDNELNEIQLELNTLPDPCNPQQVAELLELKRSCIFLQFDCAIRHSVCDIFLANGNCDTHKLITENMHFSLRFLNNYRSETMDNVYLRIPEPIDINDSFSAQIVPWRHFIECNGVFPLHLWQWYMIEPNVTLCLNGLKDMEKNIATGEILGVTLMFEDLLQTFMVEENRSNLVVEDLTAVGSNNNEFMTSSTNSKTANEMVSEPASSLPLKKGRNRNSNITSLVLYNLKGQLIDEKNCCRTMINYHKWRFFLLTWKRLELLKLVWARRKIGTEQINSAEIFTKFSEVYKKEILVPVLKILVKNPEVRETYENIVDFKQPVLLPQEVSELESKMKQIIRLLEKMDLSMIHEVTLRIQKELKLVLAERGREESTLTTDLWKKSIMKEEFTINKPHIMNDFTRIFFSKSQLECLQEEVSTSMKVIDENGGNVINNSKEIITKLIYKIDEDSLKQCLSKLGGWIQERERSNFEQYTMFYENILRQQHQLLYMKEREIQLMKDKINKQTDEVNIEVQCQMADICYDLIMEVTALRAKLTEMVETKDNLKKELREEVKAEFIDLVTDLVNVNTSLKSQVDQYKLQIHNDVLELLAESRTAAFDQINKLKDKYGIEIDETAQNQEQVRNKLIASLQKECNDLKNTLIRQEKSSKIKEFEDSVEFNKKLGKITAVTDTIQRKSTKISMLSQQNQIVLNQQKSALKRQLAKLNSEYNKLKAKMDKEV
jgi:hypothetical protein